MLPSLLQEDLKQERIDYAAETNNSQLSVVASNHEGLYLPFAPLWVDLGLFASSSLWDPSWQQPLFRISSVTVAKEKRALEGLPLIIKCCSPEMISVAAHNSWARTNTLASSNHQEARYCYPVMCPDVKEQELLVNSSYDTTGRLARCREPCAGSNSVGKQVCINWGGLSTAGWSLVPWERIILPRVAGNIGWKLQVEIYRK